MRRTVAIALLAALALLGPGARMGLAQGVCGSPNSGPCLEPHSQRGCIDADCCSTVCNLQPACCLTAWDAGCASTADETCIGLCGAAVNGPCTSPHANPSCEDAACCSAVCAIYPDCCNFNWDLLCVIIAADACEAEPPTQCGGSTQGSCTTTHPTPGCSDAACCETVCLYRAACCSFSWDQLCVDLADAYCAGCTLECPTGAALEAETCPSRLNDACIAGQTPEPLPGGAGVCGTIDGEGSSTGWSGDRDAYSILLTDPDGDGKVRLTIEFSADRPAFVTLHPAGCPIGTAIGHINASSCLIGSLAECLAPGQYVVRVSPGVHPTASASSPISCDQPLRYSLKYVAAQTGCEPICTVATGPCFDAHSGIGCSVPSCCQATCTIDPVCCSEIWDVTCARAAAEACGAPLPPNDECASAILAWPGEQSVHSTIRATVSSPALPGSCDLGQGASIGADLWFRYSGERSGTVSVATCGSTSDTRIAVYAGSCGGLTLLGCNSASQTCSPNTGARVQFSAACGTQYYIRVGGETPAVAGSFKLTVNASGPVCAAFCPADLDRNGSVTGSDLGLLLGNWGSVGSGDLDLDGTIGGADLGLLLGAWGACPPPPP